ncbi:hypothetical protein SAMN05428974_0565 [Sphingopyxis sp. YR583]|uniref:hypothetical protein n=1 Tax=Sphingopyxis sp. YR583 TaxID=1881047 RepID=UPI0008A7B425|nr:hypothetical protein [Sphingopyxis sp. YR583]SEH12799.1 hypothetical protein SAMN05428974_0565 [Sphingopyxis sp. YR583]
MATNFHLPETGTYPWIDAPYSYAGWVPNVSGHLSFGLICAGGEAQALNHRSRDGGRAIVIHRRRSAEDFPLPGRLVGHFRRSATLDYVIAARTATARTPFLLDGKLEERSEPHGVLVGAVLVLPRDSDDQASAARSALLSEIDDAIGTGIACETTEEEAAAAALPERVAALADAQRGQVACHRVNFALFRTGELRIWFDMDMFLGRDTGVRPPTAIQTLAAQILPSQIYFCLKDLTHRHYHHDPQTDQLLDLHRIDTEGLVFDDSSWRIDTLRGLAKVVVEFRHSDAPTSNKKALGVLAYADAFQSLLARVRRTRRAEEEVVPQDGVILYDFNHVRASIEALDALNESNRGALLQLFGILVGVILSAFALWAGAVQIQPILCDAMRTTTTPCPKMTPNTAVDFINWVVANPLGFVLVLAVLGFIAFIWFFKGITSVPGQRAVRIWVNRFSSAIGATLSQKSGSDNLGYAVYVAIIGMLTAGSAVVAYWIVPKTEVPSVAAAGRDVGGPWSQLDRLGGKRPSETGLFTSSVIAPHLRDLTGEDYDSFMALMAESNVLQHKKGIFWITGRAAGAGRDGAYLIIDQRHERLEIGLRREGVTTVYRSPGATIAKPPAVTQMLDGISADLGPLAVLAPVCKMSPTSSKSRGLLFEGQLPASQHCDYRIMLRAGQVFGYSLTSARGLQVAVGAPGKAALPIEQSYTAVADGEHLVRVTWQMVGGSPEERAALRRFYVRARIQ